MTVRIRNPRAAAEELQPTRLYPGDVVRVGAVGLRTRPMRAFLSALGIAIGIAAMVAVVGISSSSRAGLDRTLASLGTNLLTVSPGQTLSGGDAPLPATAERMIARIRQVESVSAVGQIKDADVYRNGKTPRIETNGLSVYAVRTGLRATIGAELRGGTWLNGAMSRYPATVLGATAAERLGVGHAKPGTQVLIGERWFTVVGILDKAPLAPELDAAALIGWPAARQELGFDGRPTTVFARTQEAYVEQVGEMLGATANPEAPGEVQVSRPSDALAAKQAASRAFTGLLLGVGGVALLVGGVGVANTMVISVLERRAEIGLRRSLGATRGHIRTQFLSESLLLSALGGLGGALLGSGATAAFALSQSWPAVVPPWALVGGVTATLAIGALAGLYPAVRASRLSPTEALATP
ncbi:ABC transporter permease [Streptomyces sp. CMB-StM0423]|uniref:ABC transporter permease n=1 Tax=Streptomyces sp. CMB-StM0423 TaxID=2059884 RepID=UPI000C709FC6|nr:ABC transporter permease [Streptomyces sp. CMB-StM0423]AUH40006.1 ABC transporter permease [Streptomyces sp. CMB-StM0423]